MKGTEIRVYIGYGKPSKDIKAKGKTACQIPTKIPIRFVSHWIPRENSNLHFLYNQGVFAKQINMYLILNKRQAILVKNRFYFEI